MSNSDELSDTTEDGRKMFEQLTARFRQFRPRSSLVRMAEVELLLHHTQFQTLAAPFLGLFLVLAFTYPGMEWWSWGWGMCLCLAYGARLVAIMRLKQSGADTLEKRLRIDLIDLAAAGVLWALAPYAVAMEGNRSSACLPGLLFWSVSSAIFSITNRRWCIWRRGSCRCCTRLGLSM